MTTSTASAPAALPFAALDAARKAAAAKSQSTWAARVAAGEVNDTDWVKKGQATRAANKARREGEIARLAAEREQIIADAPTRRAKLAVHTARKFDQAAEHRAQVEAQHARLARMKAAVFVVNTLGLRQPGTRGRKALMVTRDNFESIIARGAKKGIVA